MSIPTKPIKPPMPERHRFQTTKTIWEETRPNAHITLTSEDIKRIVGDHDDWVIHTETANVYGEVDLSISIPVSFNQEAYDAACAARQKAFERYERDLKHYEAAVAEVVARRKAHRIEALKEELARLEAQ